MTARREPAWMAKARAAGWKPLAKSSKEKSDLHWRRRGTCHYYEDAKIGWGFVWPVDGGGYAAEAYPNLFEQTLRLRDAKKLVENSVARKKRGRRS